jgi:chromosome segregation ATPase
MTNIEAIQNKHQQLKRQKIELEASIQSDRDTYDRLQQQINNQENQKRQLEEKLWNLRVEEVELDKSKSQLSVEIQNLKQLLKD